MIVLETRLGIEEHTPLSLLLASKQASKAKADMIKLARSGPSFPEAYLFYSSCQLSRGFAKIEKPSLVLHLTESLYKFILRWSYSCPNKNCLKKRSWCYIGLVAKSQKMPIINFPLKRWCRFVRLFVSKLWYDKSWSLAKLMSCKRGCEHKIQYFLQSFQQFDLKLFVKIKLTDNMKDWNKQTTN